MWALGSNGASGARRPGDGRPLTDDGVISDDDVMIPTPSGAPVGVGSGRAEGGAFISTLQRYK